MHLSTKELILCALFIALITVGTFIKIPVGTDVYTLQFLFTLLAGLLLGPRLGAIAVGTYVVMGLVGIPVFASGGGPGYIAQRAFSVGLAAGWYNGAWSIGAIVMGLLAAGKLRSMKVSTIPEFFEFYYDTKEKISGSSEDKIAPLAVFGPAVWQILSALP